MTDEILRLDADLSPIGDRVASSGWPLLHRVGLIKAEASGVTVFPGGVVAYGAAHVRMGLVINGQEIEGRQIVFDDDYLVGEGPIVGVVEPRRAVLDDFLRLGADPSDAAILGYARQYGLLGLAPTERRPGPEFVSPTVPWVGEQLAPSIGYRHAPGVAREPLRLWRRILRELATVYAMAGRLRLSQLVDREAWGPLADIVELPLSARDIVDDPAPEQAPAWAPLAGIVDLPRTAADGIEDVPPAPIAALPAGPPVPWIPVNPASLEGQRQALAAVLGAWLALGAVRPVLAWGQPGHDEPVVSLGTTTLFGGLVLELLLAVGGQAGFAICAGCGSAYLPRRRPPTGSFGAPRAAYCATCRARGLPQREAARRWREKHPDYYRERRRRPRAGGPAGA